MKKVLIIRFSSFGDVLQTLSVAGAIHRQSPLAEIHWVTRSEFAPLIETHPAIKKVWKMNRSSGWKGLLELGWRLRAENFDHVYDAHNNLRSFVLGMFFWNIRFLRRPIYRWKRFLLFRFRKNLFAKPFNGQADLLRPLDKWQLSTEAPPAPQLFLPDAAVKSAESSLKAFAAKPFVTLAPSAAFRLKRWPLEHFKKLVLLQPQSNFVILGGPEDLFLRDLVNVAPERVLNLAGTLTMEESAAVIKMGHALVANDTGLLHAAEQLGKPCIALMGPAPFGFPSRKTTVILERNLACRPCSKHGQGPCVNSDFQACLTRISPELVSEQLDKILKVQQQ